VSRHRDDFHRARRRLESALDRAWITAGQRVRRPRAVPPFDDEPRFAIVTVNASTTYFLKLMLATLAEQSHLGLVWHLVLVDNRSRDGGDGFLDALTGAAPAVTVVRNRVFLNHARGMRSGLRALERREHRLPAHDQANVVLFVDPDVVFRDPDALWNLAVAIVGHDAALAGEVRESSDRLHPNIQASFLAVRRDVLARRDVRPMISSGQPSFELQLDVIRAGLTVVDFPSNHGGQVLHRGRSAVEAASWLTPRRPYGRAASTAPHYMGVADGARIWDEIEARHAAQLRPEAEAALVASLAASFARFGTERFR
jgi:hypothetical protein